MKQMQEFKQLDEVRKRKITRYKEEADKQIDQYRQMVDILKGKQAGVKLEAEQAQKNREFAYQQTIDNL